MNRCKDCSCDTLNMDNQCDWCSGWDDGVVMVLKELPENIRNGVRVKSESARVAWQREEDRIAKIHAGRAALKQGDDK